MNQHAAISSISRAAVVTAALAVSVVVAKMAASIIAPILLAAFIAVIATTPFRWLVRKRVPKWLALAIVVIVLLEAGSIIILVFTGELETFSSGLPSLQGRLVLLGDMLGAWLEGIGLTGGREAVKDIFDPAVLVFLVRRALSNVSSTFVSGLLILLIVVFMLLEASGLPAKLQAAFGLTKEGEARLARILRAVNRYMVIKSLASLATALVLLICLWVLGINFAGLWVILAFLLNYIPFVGAVLMMIPPVLVALVQTDLQTTLLVALSIIFTNAVIGNILEPRIMGRGLGISTLAVFVSLLFWGWVFGTVGVFLATPLTIALVIALDASPQTRAIAILLGPPISQMPEQQEALRAGDGRID